MQFSKVRKVIRLIVFLTFGAAIAYAQGGSTGSLAGIVTDPSGAVVSGARVVVKSAETGLEFATTTSDNGTFNVPPMSLGNVRLVGMTVGELQDLIEIRKAEDRVITYLPQDVILNTRRAFNVDVTSPTGYSALGAPTGRYIAPANSNGCVQAFTGGCGFSRLVLDGPNFTRFDLSVVKKVRINERSNLEFRAEFLNAFNNINFLIGGTAAVDVATIANFAAGDFGRLQNTWAYQDVSTTNDPGGRLIQFVLRINF